LGSREIMRYLNKRVPQEGIDGAFKGDAVTDLAERREGVRIKHRVKGNWIKMYDKQDTVLRVETVINDARDLKVYRRAEGEARSEPKRWRPMRKGVADVRRRAEFWQQANERYLAALAAVEAHEPLGTLSRSVCRRERWHGRSVRAMNPLAREDGALLAAIYRGDFLYHGFRNRDLCRLATAGSPAAVTRQLRMLRAHGLIRKVSHTHRYLLTTHGRVIVAALLAARQADTATLARAA
jgi:DNA-binding transcriptional ArsR family regulator